jgi:hypothetical protein
LAITADGELVLTIVLFVGTKLTFTAPRRKVCAGGVSEGKLVAPASSFLTLVRVWVAEREGVAVGGEFVRSNLKPVVVDRACAAHLYVAGVDERG